MFEGKALPFGETITLDEAGHVHHEHAAVQRDEQVEALLLPDLADDDAFGSHPQCFLHKSPQPDLAGALEVRLPGLHRDDVRQGQAEFETSSQVTTVTRLTDTLADRAIPPLRGTLRRPRPATAARCAGH
jgi:hypothetical protein